MFGYKSVVFLLLLGNIRPSSWKFEDYCTIRCTSGTHLVCERADEKCGLGPLCKDALRPFITNEIRQGVLDEINEIRNSVARGDWRHLPHAANMRALQWHYELEMIAQCEANQCKWNKNYDFCRQTAEFKFEQTRLDTYMFTTKMDYRKVRVDFFKAKVRKWWFQAFYHMDMKLDRHKQNRTTIIEWIHRYYDLFNDTIDDHNQRWHFKYLAAILWAKTEYVGCGLMRYNRDDDYSPYPQLMRGMLICNFAGHTDPYSYGSPAWGHPIYEIGEPCSKCGDFKCNKEYTSLCGETRPVEEIYHDHFILGAATITLNKYLLVMCLLTSGLLVTKLLI